MTYIDHQIGSDIYNILNPKRHRESAVRTRSYVAIYMYYNVIYYIWDMLSAAVAAEVPMVKVVENKMAGCHPPRSKYSHSVRPSPWSPPSRAPRHRQQQQPTNVRDPPARLAVVADCLEGVRMLYTYIRKTPYARVMHHA